MKASQFTIVFTSALAFLCVQGPIAAHAGPPPLETYRMIESFRNPALSSLGTSSIAFDRLSGHLFSLSVEDVDSIFLFELTAHGEILDLIFMDPLSRSSSVAADPHTGNLWLTERTGSFPNEMRSIVEFLPTGDRLGSFETDAGMGITVDTSTGNLFAVTIGGTSGALVVYATETTTSGAFVNQINLSDAGVQFSGTSFLGLGYRDSTGNLLVAELSGARLVEVSPTGELVGTLDLRAVADLRDPTGVAVDPVNDHIFVADQVGLKIYVLAPPQVVEIDIKPGEGGSNAINPNSRGVIPVALLGTDQFDVGAVENSSLSFGPGAASPRRLTVTDVNGDSHLDLLAHFATPETGITSGDDEACLNGENHAGEPIVGCDAIRTVPRGRQRSPTRRSHPHL